MRPPPTPSKVINIGIRPRPKPVDGPSTVGTAAALSWWRTFPPTDFDNGRLEQVSNLLSRLAILREPDWSAAVAGEANAAIGVALRATQGVQVPTTLVDIAVTTLLRPAAAGSPAAILVLSTILHQLVGGTDRDCLACAWIAFGGMAPNGFDPVSKLMFHDSPRNDRP